MEPKGSNPKGDYSKGVYSDQLRVFLRRILRRTVLLHIASGLTSFVAVAAWAFVGLILWTALASEPALATANAVARVTGVSLFGLFLYLVVWPLIRMPRLDRLATEVESRQDLKEMVRAGFEFANDETASQRYAPELIKEVIRQAVDKVSGLQVRFLFLGRRDLALVPIAYGGLVVLLLLSLFNPGILQRAGTRIVDPAAAAAPDHRANIYATPGNITVLAGADVEVSGLDLGKSDTDVTIRYNLAADFWKTEPTERVDGHDEAGASDLSFDRYNYTFHELRQTISYYFASDDYQSETYTITVVHEPILTDIRIKLTPPKYTGEPTVVLNDNGGNVQALEGTKVEIQATSNNKLSKAWVQFDEKKQQPADLTQRQVKFDFTALKDGHYSVLLEDERGYTTRDPLVYAVEVFQDNPPALEVLEPGGDATLPRNQLIDIGFVASDDYGVSRAAIYYRKNGDAEFKRIGVGLGEDRGSKELAAAYRWDLSDITLFPGNYVEFFVQVADNNVVTGPGIAKSRLFQISMPTMAELYDNIKEEDAKRTDMMEEALRQSEEFHERLEKIKREFIKTEQMEWAQKKDVDRANEQRQAVEEKIEEIKQSLDETMRELAENEMTSQEIGEKMEEIRKLLEDLDSEKLREHMDALREAIEKMDLQEIREALENLDMDAEKMLEKLQRTAELLKQIQKEQQMEELVRKSKDLMDEQKSLNEETEESSESDAEQMEDLAKKQDELVKKAGDLQDSIEKTESKMDDPQVSEQLREMSEQLDEKKDGASKDMKKASEALQDQQKSQAMEEQQKAMDKMISLFQKASKAQESMQQNQGQKLAVNLQKFARQTLELSFRQEKLTADLRDGGVGEQPVDFRSLTQKQMSYLKATEKVADGVMEMSGQSLAVSPQLMAALGATIERMQSSVLFLEQNKPFMSTAHANNAIESLNEATIEMLKSAKQCSAGSPNGSGQSMAQQMMEQLIPNQQSILQQTREMMQMQMMQEAMAQERQAQLDRLAGQQRSMQEIAKQIQESMKEEREGLGRLDRVIEEMEAVARSLESGRLDSNLVNKEQRILSRLLDAERSIHTRDYEQKRQSVTAEEMFSRSLGTRPDAPASQSLREEIRRAMQLKAPSEFEDLIKLYFRALAEESSVAAPR